MLRHGGGCSDAKDVDNDRVITIPQEALQVTIGASSGLEHSIGFQSKAPWQASVLESRAAEWISISPTSGDAGQNNITVTLLENSGDKSRKAVITIRSGGETIDITITQRATGEPEEPENPDDPENPENPDETDRPEVKPENRLNMIEINDTENYNGSPSQHKGQVTFAYDNEGKLIELNNYSFSTEHPNKIDFSSRNKVTWSKDGFTTTGKDLEISNRFDDLPIAHRGEFTTKVTLNTSGLITKYVENYDGFDHQTTYTYNPDGTLASGECRDMWSSTYTWDKNGDLTRMEETEVRGSSTYNCTYTYTYTEHLCPWNGVDISSLLIQANNTDGMVTLFGLNGLTPKHLPAMRQGSDGSSDKFEYTFDAEGRIATIIITSDHTNDYINRSEYTLHYGPARYPEHEYIPYLQHQNVVEQGTLNYIFETNGDPQSPRRYDPQAYTSYVKIRSMLTDGTIREQTKYATINIDVRHVDGSAMPPVSVDQSNIDNFRIERISLSENSMEEGNINPHRFTYRIEYNCFDVDLECTVFYSYYDFYSTETSKVEQKLMPMIPLSKEHFILQTPVIVPWDLDLGIYGYMQKVVFKINPDPEVQPYILELHRELHTKTR